MSIVNKLAARYVFGSKSTNVINIITGIAVFGVAIGTAALILILSVFNGFEDLISGLFNKFNPDIKVTTALGKTFSPDTLDILKISQIKGVHAVSKTLEELALLEYGNAQTFAHIKGVDSSFANVAAVKDAIVEGTYKNAGRDTTVIFPGAGVAQRLGINIDAVDKMSVYVPKETSGLSLSSPFNVKYLIPQGIFAIQQEFDQEYALVALTTARELLGHPNELSALEIKVDSNYQVSEVQRQIEQITGGSYKVQNRFQQDEAFMKLMNLEKWMSYAIVCLTLLLVAFNMVGALWIIAADKRHDLSILKAMGLTDNNAYRIFIRSGVILSVLGMLLGFAIALILYWLQVHYGLVRIPEGFVVNKYPVALRWRDFIVVGVTVICIGFASSLPSAGNARRVIAHIENE